LGDRLLVRDTVTNVRHIMRALQEVEMTETADTLPYACKWIKADEARRCLVELLTDKRRPRDLTITVNEQANTLLVRGPARKIMEAKAILTRLDVSKAGGQGLVDPGAGGRPPGAAGSRTIEAVPLTALEAPHALTTLRELLGREAGTLVADTARNTIVIRGTRQQVEEVKTALKALGETGGPAGRVRVITLERGDAAALAEALAETLKKLRPNPVRVIAPGRKAEPAPKAPAKGGPGVKKPAEKPISLIGMGNKLVVSSDDPEALALVQQLVRLYTTERQGALEVIPLKSVNAVEVARVLNEAINGRTGQERARIVADRGSNSLLVKATPLDMLTIRRLLSRSLDVESEHGEGPRTYLLGPMRHVRAEEVAKVLRDVYKGDGKSAVTVAVDPRSNTLILRGPAAVYQDAQKLVTQLDVLGKKK
jgi:type II secretory pathway component GspD/PulD (secretin)